ncbi:MAG: hypothetical protein NW208_18280 [Bryobacter sp.]|nr:hypothetical protein [Bryobacter sp.]
MGSVRKSLFLYFSVGLLGLFGHAFASRFLRVEDCTAPQFFLALLAGVFWAGIFAWLYRVFISPYLHLVWMGLILLLYFSLALSDRGGPGRLLRKIHLACAVNHDWEISYSLIYPSLFNLAFALTLLLLQAFEVVPSAPPQREPEIVSIDL